MSKTRTIYREAFVHAMPAHLRDDALYQKCDGCGRSTYVVTAFGTRCEMAQPDGTKCGGWFQVQP